MNKPTLLIIDGNSVLRRLYEAIRRNEEDSPAFAREACKQALSKVHFSIRQHQATHALIVFDPEGGCWRNDVYDGYKAGRAPAPACFRECIDPLRDDMHAQGLATARVQGYEADDTINTLAIKALARGFDVIVESTDKDLTALVDKGARIHHPFDKRFRDADWIKERFNGIEPHQVTDYLALCGDKEDGIPGIPGIGPAGAGKLLKEHQDLKRILARADSIPGAIGKRVRAGREMGELSKHLAAMREDVPLDLTPKDLRVPL